jgi:heme-degrading monooxygenase HmoA
MFEITARFTRNNTKVPFFIFQTEDTRLLEVQSKMRNELLESPGFIGISYVISEDKTQLEIITLWESEEANNNAKFTWADSFFKLSMAYNQRTGCVGEMETATIHDTKNLKLKKLSTRMTATEAGQYLKNFITKKYD